MNMAQYLELDISESLGFKYLTRQDVISMKRVWL